MLFVETRVVDADMNDVAPGELGEVVYRSPQLCAGYWGKPRGDRGGVHGGWFHSGDLVRIDEEGYMFVVDRIKDVVNTGGVLVASREVEDALYGHPAVAEVAVIGLPHERWIEAIAAVVVLKETSTENSSRSPSSVSRPQGPEIGPRCRRAAEERLGQAAQARPCAALGGIGSAVPASRSQTTT